VATSKPASAAKVPITADDIKAAERAEIVAQALRRQAAMRRPSPAPVEVGPSALELSEAKLRALHDPSASAEARMSAVAEAQRQEAMARSAANGYREWELALSEYGRARLAELREQKRRREVRRSAGDEPGPRF
jgi:hypothetical protein